MTGKRHIVLIFLLVVSFSCSCLALTPPVKKSNSRGVRIGFGPVLGFYTTNPNHTRNAVQKMSAMAGFKKEVRLSRDHRSFLSVGVDYFFHGLNFQTYYFKPDSIKLYDKSFGYKYSLFVQEINIPIQFRYSFRRENNSLFSPYVMVGYHLRYLLPASLKITQNGNLVRSDIPDLKFEHPLISSQMNAFISASLGWQKNSTASSRNGFFVELNYRYGFSAYYFEKDYAPTSLFVNGSHLALLVGLRF